MDFDDCIIPKDGLDLEGLLDDWRWLLPDSYTVILINRFAEFLIEDQAGNIYSLEPGAGMLRVIAKSRDELDAVFEDDERLADLLMAGPIEDCVEAGMQLSAGKCYGFKKPCTLGGEFDVSNYEVKSLLVYLSVMGQFHEQIKDVPDGTEIGSITLDGVPIVAKS